MTARLTSMSNKLKYKSLVLVNVNKSLILNTFCS